MAPSLVRQTTALARTTAAQPGAGCGVGRVAGASSSLVARRGHAPVRCFASLFPESGKKERVVILGSGWAGYAFARTLNPAKYERIIVSPRSYFVFTPLLASTAVGTLEFRTTLESVRRLGKHIRFYQGWADDIDFDRKIVRVEENQLDDLSSRTILPPPPPRDSQGRARPEEAPVEPPHKNKGTIDELQYDKLVIAVGAYSQTFGIEGVRQHAHFLRDIGDARKIRLRVLSLFEQCTSHSMSDETRRKLLHFAIVGGGPTGVEFAAELHDLIHEDLAKLYPALIKHVNITVYDISPKILPMFDQALASYAMNVFQRQKISVKTNHSIQRIAPDASTGGLRLKIKEYGDDEVGAGIVVWSTGLMQNPLVDKLMRKTVAGQATRGATEHKHGAFRLEKDRKTGGIIVDECLRARLVPSETAASSSTTPATPTTNPDEQPTQILPSVFVIGDCAVIASQPDLPKTAQVASQEAAYLAKALNKDASFSAAQPFKFRNLGTMTYLGNWKAIHQSRADHLKGWLAWVLWRTAYLTRSMSMKNKILLPVYWFVSYVFGRDISRF